MSTQSNDTSVSIRPLPLAVNAAAGAHSSDAAERLGGNTAAIMMVRRATERGSFDFGWLRTSHSFSFGEYRDRNWMGFASLRVMNEDHIAPGKGFGQHPHDNMEIISYIPAGGGRIAHRDTLGTVATIGPGEIQRMSAGTGVEHSEFNPSTTEPTHLIQVWITPAERGQRPRYDQRKFAIHEEPNRLHLLVSPGGDEGSLPIGQDAKMYAATAKSGWSQTVTIAAGRSAWVQVVSGSVTLNEVTLGSGDGVAIRGESAAGVPRAGGFQLALSADRDSEFLLFDLV